VPGNSLPGCASRVADAHANASTAAGVHAAVAGRAAQAGFAIAGRVVAAHLPELDALRLSAAVRDDETGTVLLVIAEVRAIAGLLLATAIVLLAQGGFRAPPASATDAATAWAAPLRAKPVALRRARPLQTGARLRGCGRCENRRHVHRTREGGRSPQQRLPADPLLLGHLCLERRSRPTWRRSTTRPCSQAWRHGTMQMPLGQQVSMQHSPGPHPLPDSRSHGGYEGP
jgi:hypothetical protein